MSAATVISGSEKLTTESLVGQTVYEVRESFADVLNIPDEANALVNGRGVSEDYALRAGEELIFSRPVGSKGTN